MKTKLTAEEGRLIAGILRRMDAGCLLDFDTYDIFKFSNRNCQDFLVELPKVVSILSAHKGEFRYDAFIRSMSIVVEVLSEVYLWKFCFDSIQDFLDSVKEYNDSMKEGGGV